MPPSLIAGLSLKRLRMLFLVSTELVAERKDRSLPDMIDAFAADKQRFQTPSNRSFEFVVLGPGYPSWWSNQSWTENVERWRDVDVILYDIWGTGVCLKWKGLDTGHSIPPNPDQTTAILSAHCHENGPRASDGLSKCFF